MKKRVASYFTLAITIFFLLNLPIPYVTGLRSKMLFAEGKFTSKKALETEGEILQLKIENKKLKDDLTEIRNWIASEDRIETHIKRIEEVAKISDYREFYKRRIIDLLYRLKKEIYAVEASVLFRDPTFWSSGFWVNKGERDNKNLATKIIQKNSPVLVGDFLIGIIEIVEEKRSYVRLLTDASLTPAVRAVRGEEQDYILEQNIIALQEALHLQDSFSSENLLKELDQFKSNLNRNREPHHLAKGELKGSAYPLWRCRSPLLKGSGFNYEFSDEEGIGHTIHDKLKTPLLDIGDLLVTTGLDGVFPKGIPVAIVSKIFPLMEGDFAYEIQARLLAGSLDNLNNVQIYPPLDK